MAIPDGPMNFDPLNIELDDLVWMLGFMEAASNQETSRLDAQTMVRLCDVLSQGSSWTRAEWGHLTARELMQTIGRLNEAGALKEAIPPSNGDALQPGPTA